MTITDCFLQNKTLKEEVSGEKIARILAAALTAVDPARLIQEKIARDGNQLVLPDGEVIDLDEPGRIFLLGLGKAAKPMSLSLADLLQDQLDQGWIITKGKADPLPSGYRKNLEIFGASHPVPNVDGVQATRAVLERLSGLSPEDLVILLISGGGSALFIQPAQGLTLSQIQKTNQVLLDCGADIREINSIRKHLSLVKGGQLAKHLQPASVFTLILSDVMGDPLDVIASGPTVPDTSTFEDALAVIEEYDLWNRLPETILDHLKKGREGQIPETPKPGDPCFDRQKTSILAGNLDALQGAQTQAELEGFQSSILPQALIGEARSVGENMAHKLKDLVQNNGPTSGPACLIAGGETTVTLPSSIQSGSGGRNLELALSALPILDGLDDCLLVTLATDGEDGVTEAAGAVVSGSSFERCRQIGLDPLAFLERHDSHSLFQALDDLLLPGPTGTNVNDLCFLFTF